MSVLSIARVDGAPRAVFDALQHHWAGHPADGRLKARTVAHGPAGFVVVETWDGAETARAAWSVIRLAGIPAPDLELYDVVARTGGRDENSLRNWIELAIPDASAWEAGTVPMDS